MGLFRRNIYLQAKNDTPEELKRKGVPVLSQINSITERKGKFVITVSPTSGIYKDKVWRTEVTAVPNDVSIGSMIYVYVDEVDADGEYYIDLREV